MSHLNAVAQFRLSNDYSISKLPCAPPVHHQALTAPTVASSVSQSRASRPSLAVASLQRNGPRWPTARLGAVGPRCHAINQGVPKFEPHRRRVNAARGGLWRRDDGVLGGMRRRLWSTVRLWRKLATRGKGDFSHEGVVWKFGRSVNKCKCCCKSDTLRYTRSYSPPLTAIGGKGISAWIL